MKKLLVFTAALALFLLPAFSTLYAGEVGFINVKRVVAESTAGKTAAQELTRSKDQKEAEVKKQLSLLQSLKDQIEKDGDKLSPAQRQERLQDFQKAKIEYDRMTKAANEDLQMENRELVNNVLIQADPVLKKIAKERKFTIILTDPTVIGYLDPSVDITDEVISALNK
ncbi:MAG: OmpH family outer membrane protein [Thermodesulfobacteriota bacterium]